MLERKKAICLTCKHLKEYALDELSDIERTHYFCSQMKTEIKSAMAKEPGISYIPCITKCDMHEKNKAGTKV